MAIERDKVLATLQELGRLKDLGDWKGWVELFAEDCTFDNSALPEPVVGREALLALTETWPEIDNNFEWVAIDGNRFVCGWNERQEGMPPDAPAYRGVSTFVFNDDGLVASYEGIFDTAAMMAATGRSA